MTALTLDRLTLRGPAPLGPRKRALRRLEKAAPNVSGPPSEILIIRKLHDPAPGALASRGQKNVLPKWEQAAAAAISGFRDRASRPRPGMFDDTYDAVIFADEAEMIACIAERVAAGRGTAWWARAFMRKMRPGHSLGGLLTDQAHLVSPILTHLIARGTASAVLHALTPTDIDAIVHILGLRPKTDAHSKAQTAPQTHDRQMATRQVVSVPQSIADIIATVPQHLGRLLVAAWLRQHRQQMPPADIEKLVDQIMEDQIFARRFANSDPRSKAATRKAIAAEGDGSAQLTKPDQRQQKALRSDADNLPTSAAPHQSGETPNVLPRPKEHLPIAKSHAPKSKAMETPASDAAVNDAASDAPPIQRDGISTAYGGALFLINLYINPIRARAAEMTAALTAAMRPDDGKWTAVWRLSKAMLSSEKAADNDALWKIFASLDEGGDHSPVSLTDADNAAADACRLWLGSAGWDANAAIEDAEITALLAGPAHVHVTPAHLDVVFPIHAQKLPVRRAGLDLDPGWQPQFGRIVTFHYREEKDF